MKVMYDISVLGVGHIIPKGRTGVFRVVENVARQLVLNPECHVKFCSTRDLETVQYAIAYMKNSKAVSSVPFSKPAFFDRRWKLINRKNGLIKLINDNTQLSTIKRLQIKLQIKELVAIERVYQLISEELMHPRDVKQAEIYHSPFYALPEPGRIGSFKSVFITCYDLIPILFPEYFEQSIIDLMDKILGCMTTETWVLCISESTRNDLLNHLGKKVNPERVIVTELAASDTFYQSTDRDNNLMIRRKHNIPDVPYILSLCTFEPRKNIDQVIRAFARIIAQENIKDLHLVLVGSKGWLFDKIFEQIADSAEIKSKIIITGFVADEDLAAIYSDAMFFVYPSFYEGFGLPPLEAMKCGTPVITSNTSSLPEVVGDAGIMVAPSDLDSLCEAMVSVYKSSALREQMATQSLQRSCQFSWERCGQKTVDAYADSLRI